MFKVKRSEPGRRRISGPGIGLGLALILAGGAAPGTWTAMTRNDSPSVNSADHAYNALVDEFFDGFFHFYPGRATRAGLHQYDAELPAYSRHDIEGEIARSQRALELLAHIPTQALSRPNRFDARLLESSIRGHLLNLENIRLWENSPAYYNTIISGALFSLVQRDYAPVDERLKRLIARERLVPAVLESARQNVSNPPAVFTDIAIHQVKSEISFLQNDLPLAVAGARDAAGMAEFQKVNGQAIEAYQSYLAYLQNDLTPRSHGEFAIGAANFQKKLLYDEMVSMRLDKLLALGEHELRKTQAAYIETAKLIDASKTPAEVLNSLSLDHPDADKVIPETQALMAGLRKFVVSHNIATIQSSQDPRVVETPAFMRALTAASMDTPGPYEEASSEAFFNVTLPENEWSDARKEQLLRSLNRTGMIITAIHEAFPGHYVQFLWLKQIPSKTRRLAGALHEPWGEVGSNGEGWAHYCEQMMLEQGYGEGDPKLLLMQLHGALLRICRYIVGIRMHTRGMTLQEGIDYFNKEGYTEQVTAEQEARRGTMDPTYLVYTLGKLQILKLREDYRKKEGHYFNLREFHDSFLSYGNPPIQMIREDMLGDKTPAL
jgi:uncharacterized protein (DUF885 family)